ncbi:MAG: hypothetical protein U0Q22_16120 [Acidimicrobiales bacterium]
MATKTSTSSATTTKKTSRKAGSTSVATRKSRAVVRDVEAGSSVDCAHCGERVKFQAKVRNKQVICNVYVKGAWNRVEHFHLDCYGVAGSPHGEAEVGTDYRRQAANAAAAERARKLAEESPAKSA